MHRPATDNISIIGIAGASGAGKTTFANQLTAALHPRGVVHLSQDHYYKDRSELSPVQRAKVNYDHPDAIDLESLKRHLKALKAGNAIRAPLYDFKKHNRIKKTIGIKPSDLIILEGLLILAVAGVRDLMDIKIFIETPLDICFIRRLGRDHIHRGRSVESVIEQYLKTVRPMYYAFVQPTRAFADLVIAGDGNMDQALKRVIDRLAKK